MNIEGKIKGCSGCNRRIFLTDSQVPISSIWNTWEHYEYDNMVMKDKTRLSISKANRKKVRERLLQTEKKKIMNIHLITYLTSKLFWIYTVFRYNTILYPKMRIHKKLFA